MSFSCPTYLGYPIRAMASHSVSVVVAVFLTLALLVGAAQPVTAQSPYTKCAHRTSTNASLILPSDLEVTLDGVPLKKPFYMAVFTPEGRCAGSANWSGTGVTLTAWGTDEDASSSVDPATIFSPGDSMHVRLFIPASDTEYTSTNHQIAVSFRSGQPHLTTHHRYVPNGIYVVDQIGVSKRLVSNQ